MGTTKIQFNMSEAKKTQRDLENEIGEIRKAFKRLSDEVANTKEWWKGKSQKDFVGIFDQHQEEVLKAINEWLKKYGELVMEYGDAYSKADAGMFGR